MKIKAFHNGSGARYWRLDDPFKYLRNIGVDAEVTDENITDRIVQENDIFVCQFTVDKEGLALLRAYQQLQGKKIVAEFDDFIEINPDNPNKMEHEVSNASEILKVLASIADMITTTNNNLSKKLKEYNDNVVVLPNYMDLERWSKPYLKNETGYVNIGWCGGMSHYNDLEMIVEPLKRILNDFPNVRLYIVGEWRARKWFEGYKNVEIMLAVPFDAYPTRLAGLRLDIGLAPLLDNEFNKCKSNIKWQEYSINRIAGVYSPTVYNSHGFDPKFGRIATTPDDWYNSIKQLIIYPKLRKEVATSAYELVKTNYNLEKHIGEWVKAYKTLT